MMDNRIYFAHGQESGPWGSKIMRLAAVGRQKGFEIVSPDFSGEKDPDKRVEQLIALRPSAKKRLILVGSSMGGYVVTVASQVIRPQGLFLMAPAFYIAGWRRQAPRPLADRVQIIHGRQDDVVPLAHSIRFSEAFAVPLAVVEADHRLTCALPEIEGLFAEFLEDLLRIEDHGS